MKINVDTVLSGLDGAALSGARGPLTLREVVIEVLMGTLDVDKDSTGAEKLALYQLAVKVNAGGMVDLLPEETSVLKERVGMGYGPVVIGPAYALLDG